MTTNINTTRSRRNALAAGVAATIVVGTAILGGTAARADEPVTTKDSQSVVGAIAPTGSAGGVDRGADEESAMANAGDDDHALAERQLELAIRLMNWQAEQMKLQKQQ